MQLEYRQQSRNESFRYSSHQRLPSRWNQNICQVYRQGPNLGPTGIRPDELHASCWLRPSTCLPTVLSSSADFQSLLSMFPCQFGHFWGSQVPMCGWKKSPPFLPLKHVEESNFHIVPNKEITDSCKCFYLSILGTGCLDKKLSVIQFGFKWI